MRCFFLVLVLMVTRPCVSMAQDPMVQPYCISENWPSNCLPAKLSGYDYAIIAKHVNKKKLIIGMKTKTGWEIIKIDQNPKSGYLGALYRFELAANFRYVYAIQGTRPLSVKDWVNNFKQIKGKSKQFDDAAKFAQKHKAHYQQLSFTGHSLGGGLASLCALLTQSEAVTFNANGLSSHTLHKYNVVHKPALITAYVVKGELLSTLQAIIGLQPHGTPYYIQNQKYIYFVPLLLGDMLRLYQRAMNHKMDAVLHYWEQNNANSIKKTDN